MTNATPAYTVATYYCCNGVRRPYTAGSAASVARIADHPSYALYVMVSDRDDRLPVRSIEVAWSPTAAGRRSALIAAANEARAA